MNKSIIFAFTMIAALTVTQFASSRGHEVPHGDDKGGTSIHNSHDSTHAEIHDNSDEVVTTSTKKAGKTGGNVQDVGGLDASTKNAEKPTDESTVKTSKDAH